jgi:fibronectin type 3 domain-containing protein
MSYTDEGLEDRKEYFYYITSIDQYNNESRSSEIVSGITKDKPVPIKEFFASSGEVRECQLTWSNVGVSQSAKINIYRGDVEEANKMLKIASLDSQQSEYIDKKLKDGMFYFYSLQVEDEGLVSNFTGSIKINTKPLHPCPNKLTGKYIDKSNTLVLEWDAVTEAITYNIYQSRFLVDKKIASTQENHVNMEVKIKKGNTQHYYVTAVDEFKRESDKSIEVNVKNEKNDQS